jgi:hypothetical protein
MIACATHVSTMQKCFEKIGSTLVVSIEVLNTSRLIGNIFTLLTTKGKHV